MLMLGLKALKTVQINTFPVRFKQLGWDVSLKQIFECIRKVSKISSKV